MNLPAEDQPPEGDTPQTPPANECMICGEAFPSTRQAFLHLTKVHYDSDPINADAVGVGLAHGTMLSDQGMEALLRMSLLVAIECDCGEDHAPELRLIQVAFPLDEIPELAQAMAEAGTIEAYTAAMAKGEAKEDNKDG
jgi:hypothetical protein